MTTKELVEWCFKAQEIKENSWDKETLSYTKTIKQAVEETKPENATERDSDMAVCLNSSLWNEIQIWKEMQ